MPYEDNQLRFVPPRPRFVPPPSLPSVESHAAPPEVRKMVARPAATPKRTPKPRKPRAPKTMPTEEYLRRRFLDDGLTMQQIAEESKVGPSTVLRLVGQYKIRRGRLKPERGPSEGTLRQKYVVEGLSTRQIAREAKIGVTTVKRLLARYGIPVRPTGGHVGLGVGRCHSPEAIQKIIAARNARQQETGGRSRLRTFEGPSRGAVDLHAWRMARKLGSNAMGAALGCNASLTYSWERGKSLPDIVLAARIEDLTGILMRAWTVAAVHSLPPIEEASTAQPSGITPDEVDAILREAGIYR